MIIEKYYNRMLKMCKTFKVSDNIDAPLNSPFKKTLKINFFMPAR